jgi:hypothetical protein
MVMLYGSTSIQLMISWGGEWTFALGNLVIHMFVSFVVANYSTCDSLFVEFIVMCIIIAKTIYNFFALN